MLKKSLSLLAIFLYGTWAAANAQPPGESGESKRRATETFLDSAKPTAERLEAAAHLGYPAAETFTELLRVGTDTNEPDAVRLAALKKYRFDDKYIDTVLAIIADTQSGESLAAGLIENVSRRTTFRQPAALRQRLQDALRDRLDDPRDAVRLWSYRALVSGHDQTAIDKLAESLRNGSGVPVPLADAIDLLDIDGSAKHIVTLRPYLSHSDPNVRAQAARALAIDPESRQAIVSMATNAETPQVVRLHALRALAREDEGFLEYAIELVGNGREAPEIRHAAMSAAVGRMNYHEVPAATQVSFALTVQRLAAEKNVRTKDGVDVAAEAEKLLAYLRKTFPAVRKHFAIR